MFLNILELEEGLANHEIKQHLTSCLFCELDADITILEETNNFYLIKDKYPIVEGHLMIISKDHYGCFGELPFSFMSEIQILKNSIDNYFKNKKFISYEHGRAGHCVKLKDSEVSCHHFHLHFVPLASDIQPQLLQKYEAKKVSKLADLIKLFRRYGEYLYFANSEGEAHFYPANVHVEPHLLRTLICQQMGLEHRSNWEQL